MLAALVIHISSVMIIYFRSQSESFPVLYNIESRHKSVRAYRETAHIHAAKNRS